MFNYHTELAHSEHKRQAIYNEVRHQHLANRIHRTRKSGEGKTAVTWLHVLSRLHRIRIQISFDLEEPIPEPTGAGC